MIPEINLIPRDIEKDDSGSKPFYIILTAIFVLVLAFLLWQYFSTKSQINSLKEEEANLQQQRDNLQTELNSLTSAQGNTLEQSVQFVESVSYPVSPLIDEIQELKPERAYLRSYSFGENTVEISFDMETLNEVSKFVTALNSSPYFTDVQVTNVDHFYLNNGSDEEQDFNDVPRQSTKMVLIVNKQKLAAGGAQ